MQWQHTLDGVYQLVLQNSIKHKSKPYTNNVDIVRFFGAVYTQVNEHEYKKLRNNKKLKDEEIEKDLITFYPHYYIDMYKCLCNCALGRLVYLIRISDLYTIYQFMF